MGLATFCGLPAFTRPAVVPLHHGAGARLSIAIPAEPGFLAAGVWSRGGTVARRFRFPGRGGGPTGIMWTSREAPLSPRRRGFQGAGEFPPFAPAPPAFGNGVLMDTLSALAKARKARRTGTITGIRAPNEPKALKRYQTMPKHCRAVYAVAMRGKSRAAAIRAFCEMCVGWERREVARCTDPACPLYAYRPRKEATDATDN